MNNKITNRFERNTVQVRPGLWRTNLSYNQETMLCYFRMEKGCKLPLHNHKAVQNGYVISGKLRYELADSDHRVYETGEIGPGGGYCWDSDEYHSTEALEDSEFIEVFSPLRPEYVAE